MPLGVLSTTDICLKGELMSTPPGPFKSLSSYVRPAAATLPLAGDELKNRGDDDGMLGCRDARGVA